MQIHDCYSFTNSRGMTGWVGLVYWPVVHSLYAHLSRDRVLGRESSLTSLPLSYATIWVWVCVFLVKLSPFVFRIPVGMLFCVVDLWSFWAVLIQSLLSTADCCSAGPCSFFLKLSFSGCSEYLRIGLRNHCLTSVIRLIIIIIMTSICKVPFSLLSPQWHCRPTGL